MSDAIENRQPAMWAESEWPAGEPQPLPRAPAPEPAPRFPAVNRNQLMGRAVDVEKRVEADHLARAIGEWVGQLDLQRYTAEVGWVEGGAGRPSFEPRLLISLWVYAYREKVSSAREVERRCAYHPAYPWLTGCQIVNYPTLSDFRVPHQEARDELLAQLLGVLSSEDLITLERVTHDGTQVKASASGKSFHREKT